MCALDNSNFGKVVREQVIIEQECYTVEHMSKLTTTMKDFVADQRLAYLATVCPDGSPNLSPRGLTFVLDDRRIVIGEVRSPASIYNLGFQPIAELNVVDRNLRKGYRFKGACIAHTSGKEFDLLTEFLRSKGAVSAIKSIIVMTVENALQISSPLYDRSAHEEDVRNQWKSYYDAPDPDHVEKWTSDYWAIFNLGFSFTIKRRYGERVKTSFRHNHDYVIS